MYELKLYVLGKNPTIDENIRKLRELLKNELNNEYKLEVVDIFENSEKAEEDNIFATPTLVKKLPLPVRKVIGDISASEKVLIRLDIKK